MTNQMKIQSQINKSDFVPFPFSKLSPMGGWVDGGSAGGQTSPPPQLKVRTEWQSCTTASLYNEPLRDTSASLPFSSLPYGRSRAECSKSCKKSIVKRWVLSPLRTLWMALSVPCPWRLSAWGPLCALPFAVLDLSMGGGPIYPSQQLFNMKIEIK